MKDLISLEDWRCKLSKEITEEILKIVDREQDSLGREFALSLISTFMATFISAVVYQALSEEVKNSKNEVDKKKTYDKVYKNLSDMKEGMQDAIAAGFQGAMSTFSGKPIEYYCQIKTIPEPMNKKPC